MSQEPFIDVVCCDLVAELVRSTGSAKLQVTGLSMLPAIWPGDELTIQRQPPDQFAPGQVVFFRRNGGVVAHRIVRIADDRLFTRGDSNPELDAPVSWDEVIGRVAGIRRNGLPVRLQPSFAQRMMAWALRRSHFALRLLLHFHPIAQKSSYVSAQ
jgi:signal peptidase I